MYFDENIFVMSKQMPAYYLNEYYLNKLIPANYFISVLYAALICAF